LALATKQSSLALSVAVLDCRVASPKGKLQGNFLLPRHEAWRPIYPNKKAPEGAFQITTVTQA
jgi:hypothetical protein